MPSTREQAIRKMRRDHEHMLGLIQRIQAECSQRDSIDHCNDCPPSLRPVCHGNIKQLIGAFVEATLKHNLMESMFMEKFVPLAHRIAHNQAHLGIAQQLKEIRLVFAEDGNGILAIEGIDRVQHTLLTHLQEYDQPLETYLAAAAET